MHISLLPFQAWLDLRTEPMVLSLPSNVDRYFSMQMVDGYTFNFCILGIRKNSSGNFLIAGPNWEGKVPPGFDPQKVLTSESEYVLLLGRTEVNGKRDLPHAWAIQQKYGLVPLSVFLGGPQIPPLPEPAFLPFSANPDDLKDATYFFNRANFIMSYIAIYPTEASIFENFSKIGIEPGKTFPPASMDNITLQAIQEGLLQGDALINAALAGLGTDAPPPNGWSVHVDPPPFGNRSVMQGRYLARACGARVGLYGLDPAEAFYPRSTADETGEAYDARKYNYVMKFSANGTSLPNVHAFWSLSMYNNNNFFVPNVDDKYSIGDRTEGLVYEDDGKSLTIYIQQTEPSQGKPNWLPAPDGLFNLVLRLYWPDDSMLSPPYIPPAVTKVLMQDYTKDKIIYKST